MKSTRIAAVIACSTLLVTACKKDNKSSTPSSNTSTSNPIRIQEGVDPDITQDTVYLLSYDASGRLSKIIDSLNQDTLIATYDGSGNLTTITDHGIDPFNATYTYDASNHLTQQDYTLAGSVERYTFDYSNGVASKKTYYSDEGLGGSLILQNYYNYTVSNNNVTSVAAYTANGTLQQTITVAYSSQANPFKALCLFNYGNRLGLDNLMPIDLSFSSNLCSSASSSIVSANYNVTYNANQQPTKVVVSIPFYQEQYTWQFTYK